MEVLIISALTFFTSIIGTVAGFGISTTLIPILAFFLPLPQTLLLVAVLHVFGDTWKILFFYRSINWKTSVQFGIAAVIGSVIGANLLFIFSPGILSKLLGGSIVAYALSLFFNPSIKLKENFFTNITGGLTSGGLTGLTGLGGVVRSAIVSSYRIKKNVYIGTVGIIALITDISRLLVYSINGAQLQQSLTRGLIFFIPASFLGAWIAQKIIRHIPEQPFRLLLAFFLLLAGLRFLLI